MHLQSFSVNDSARFGFIEVNSFRALSFSDPDMLGLSSYQMAVVAPDCTVVRTDSLPAVTNTSLDLLGTDDLTAFLQSGVDAAQGGESATCHSRSLKASQKSSM